MLVAEASSVTEYSSAAYGDANSNVVPDSSAYVTEGTGVCAIAAGVAYTVPAASSFADGNICGTGVNSSYEKQDVGMSNASNASVEPGQTAVYASTVNGNSSGEVGGNQAAENGTSGADVAEQHYVDGSGMYAVYF